MKYDKITLDFSKDMAAVLRLNNDKGNWKKENKNYLNGKIMEEVVELLLCNDAEPYDIIKTCTVWVENKVNKKKGTIRREAIDVGNLALMIWDNDVYPNRKQKNE